MNLSEEELEIWNINRLINPVSKRPIKDNGPTYKKILKQYTEYENKKKTMAASITKKTVTLKINNNRKKIKKKKIYTRKDINNINKLQKIIREKHLNKISGPGYKNPLLCNNNRDIISLDNIWIEENNNKILDLEFDKKLLFTYTNNNIIYGLNIHSLEELFNKNIYVDPFTNNKFSKEIINKIKKKIDFIKKLRIIKKKDKYTYQQIINNKIINLIKILEKNDIYLNVEWLKNLNKQKYYKLYNELQQIFNSYKESYVDIYNKMVKKDFFNYNISYLKNLDLIHLKGFIYDIIYSIISVEKENHIQKMTCYIILAGLCYVSEDIKTAYPNMQIF